MNYDNIVITSWCTPPITLLYEIFIILPKYTNRYLQLSNLISSQNILAISSEVAIRHGNSVVHLLIIRTNIHLPYYATQYDCFTFAYQKSITLTSNRLRTKSGKKSVSSSVISVIPSHQHCIILIHSVVHADDWCKTTHTSFTKSPYHIYRYFVKNNYSFLYFSPSISLCKNLFNKKSTKQRNYL